MNTNEMTREQISALTDAELSDPELDEVFAALRTNDAKADWDIYHQIGDVLRSDDMAIAMSPDFSKRMSALLEAEPIVVAPVITPFRGLEHSVPVLAKSPKADTRRWALPGMAAAAAMAAVAFVTTPHVMVALTGETNDGGASTSIATSNGTGSDSTLVTTSMTEDVILRDPQIDDYLLAHQRFSPSVYSTAQYARSTTFSNK